MKKRTLIWRRIDLPGAEHLSIEIGGDGRVKTRGVIVLAHPEGPLSCIWEIATTYGWNFASARVVLYFGNEEHEAYISRNQEGWVVNGGQRPDLAHCRDIDLEISAFTNSLPIRRLNPEPNQEETIEVAYLSAPGLEIAPARQIYTRLDEQTPPRRFRFSTGSGDFSAGLTVDGDGLVEDYDGLFERVR